MGIERQNAGSTVDLPPVNHADILDNPGKHGIKIRGIPRPESPAQTA
jgi:hypothetical protein